MTQDREQRRGTSARLADRAIRGIAGSLAFRASAAPYLLLDTDLRVRAANAAYERATLQTTSEMEGELMFDVFPDNPLTPEACSVERLGESFERALAADARDRMALQRYDVRDPGSGEFVDKSWLPSNSPVHDSDGRIVGVLHHVEDVTHLLVDTALERLLLVAPTRRDPAPDDDRTSLEQPRRDAATRRARARALLEQSHRAMDRMSRRIGADGRR